MRRAGLRTPRDDRGLVLFEKILDRQFAEIGQGAAQRLMVPVPPGQRREPVGDVFREAPLDDPRRISGDDGVGGDVLGDDGAGGDHGAGADAAARQHDGAVPDPDVMADMDVVPAPPCEEFGVVAFSRKVGAGAIGEVGLRRPLHRVVARIDSRHRRDRAELSDRGVGDLGVVHDVGIVVHRHFMQDRARRPRSRRRAWSHAGSRLGRWSVQPRAFFRSCEFPQAMKIDREARTSSMGSMTTS